MPEPRISVVIPTFNRLEHLKSCIVSLERQSYCHADFEVIVVSDGCTDGTGHYLETYKTASTLHLVVIAQENKGVSAARNRGIQEARANYIAFTDDDCILPSDWVERLVRQVASLDPYAAGLGGELVNEPGDAPRFVSNYISYLDEFRYAPVITPFGILPVHVSALKGTETIAYVRTSNAIFRKGALLQVGGFDISFVRPGGEDPDVCYRIMNNGYHFRFIRELTVRHQSRRSLSSYLSSLRNYVLGELYTNRKRLSYSCRAVRMTYTLIPLKKLVSLFIGCITYPFLAVKLIVQGHPYSLKERLSFPLLSLVAKGYAVIIASTSCRRST